MVVATERDLAVVSEILTEAAHWLIDRGEPLWRPEDLVPERLAGEVRKGALHLGKLAGTPVGTLALSFEDRVFWPDASPDDSGFVHRLAVRRRAAGTGVAPDLVRWAADRTRAAGRSWLRLDCSEAHPGLCRYYEGLGFVRHSQGSLGDYRFVRYQMPLEVDSLQWT